MRTFGTNEFLFIVYALQWTLTLTAIAFVGGGYLGRHLPCCGYRPAGH